MRRPGRIILRTSLRTSLVLLMLGAILAAFWLGLVPQRYAPFAPISLAERPSWFIDFRSGRLVRP